MAFVACAAVGVASLLPSELVADELNERIDEVQPTPYARVPSSAQPVDDRVTFGELEGLAEQFPPSGNIYFVTVTEPSQTILSWLVGRDEPAVEFLTEEEKFGFQTPQQRRAFGLESMRTSEQVAQYVALKAVGYDVTIVPGRRADQRDGVPRRQRRGHGVPRVEPVRRGARPRRPVARGRRRAARATSTISRPRSPTRNPATRSRSSSSGPSVGELTVTVELTSSPDEPDRDDRRLPPVRHATRRAAVRARHRHRPHRRAVGRAGVHADADRRADARRAHRRPERRRHRHDRARRHRRGDRRPAPEGSAVRPGRGRRVPRAGRPGRGATSHARRRGRRRRTVEIIPVATLDEALAALERARRRRRSTPRFRLPPTNSPECLRWRGMAISFSRPDPTSPASVAEAKFATARRGYRPATRCATSCAWSPPSWAGCRSASAPRARAAHRPVARGRRAPTGSTTRPSTRLLGEETCASCRPPARAASQIKIRAEEGAARILREATDDANRMREEAEIEAVAQAHRRRRRRRGRGVDGQAAGPRDGQRGTRLPRAGARRADPPPRAGPPADRAADPRSRSAAAGVRAGAPGRRRRRRRAHAARRARRVRRPVADHRAGADDGAAPAR